MAGERLEHLRESGKSVLDGLKKGLLVDLNAAC
jgi:hypothetical protein